MFSSCKRIFSIPFSLLVLVGLSASGLASDTVIKGYLTDVLCSGRNTRKPGAAAVHSKSCLQMPSCNDSGFGVLTEDKQFIKFDEEGNQKVRKFLAETSNDHDFKIVVSGSMDGEKMKVTKIELQ